MHAKTNTRGKHDSSSSSSSSSDHCVSPFKVLLSIMFFGFFVVAFFSYASDDFHIKKEYDSDKAVEGLNRQKQEMLKQQKYQMKEKLAKIKMMKNKEQTTSTAPPEEKPESDADDHAATIEAGTNKKVWEEYSFSSSRDKEKLHPESAKTTSEIKTTTETSRVTRKTTSVGRHSDEVEYRFELDRPRAPDEEKFFHLPKSQGGHLLPLPTRPPHLRDDDDADRAIISSNASKKTLRHHDNDNDAENDRELPWTKETFQCAEHLHRMFSMYDDIENAVDSIAVYGTMRVGGDCEFIIPMIAHLDVAIGHFIVVLSSNIGRFVQLFFALMKQFPGRFTVFHRPEKLSCAESWNLVVRMGFAHVKPMPDQIFIANADWHPVPSGDIKRNFARFLEFSRRNLDKVINRYYHFSSFAYTKKGYLELGYFDEVIFPALSEDVEAHLKAVSKGMGELGLYDKWKEGSKHITRASAGDKTIQQRNGQVARFDYILRKWGIRVPQYTDFANAPAYKHPFNIPWLHHNNSWVVDPEHRKCAKTGIGKKMPNSGRCYYDARVLLKLFPENGIPLEKGVGSIIGKDDRNAGIWMRKEQYRFPNALTTDKDSFPGPYH